MWEGKPQWGKPTQLGSETTAYNPFIVSTCGGTGKKPLSQPDVQIRIGNAKTFSVLDVGGKPQWGNPSNRGLTTIILARDGTGRAHAGNETTNKINHITS